MVDQELHLTEEERSYLTELLEWTLKEMQVEEHRTRKPTYREQVIKREEIVRGLLDKLKG